MGQSAERTWIEPPQCLYGGGEYKGISLEVKGRIAAVDRSVMVGTDESEVLQDVDASRLSHRT
jgi:hypothetical protein